MEVTVKVEIRIKHKKKISTASVKLDDSFCAYPSHEQSEQNKIEATVRTLLESLK